jgi:hypothetical protein
MVQAKQQPRFVGAGSQFGSCELDWDRAEAA